MTGVGGPDPAVRDALAVLGVEHLLLGIHDRSFPGDAAEDTGAGSPYSAAGHRFLHFVRSLGFTGVQLGPQGETTADDPSPYNGTLFSRGCVSIALARLAERDAWAEILPRSVLDDLVTTAASSPRERIRYGDVHRAHGAALARAFEEFAARRGRGDPELEETATRFETFKREHQAWLERDALYEILRRVHGDAWWPRWDDALDRTLLVPEPGHAGTAAQRRQHLLAEHRGAVECYAFAQFVAHDQHRDLRVVARILGLTLWGDLQIGFSARDAWAHQGLFLTGHALGAPPSRTNPEGQPWNYPILDPRLAAGVAFVSRRVDKLFAEFDGVRIDHPHGLVCPWVYDVHAPDALRAVQHGARLFDSPALPDHPALAGFAIARAAQLNPAPRTLRHADDWVVALEPQQVRRYSRLMDAIVDAARRHGGGPASLACEVLSTCPYPLARVLATHGLGRFRITQKADLGRADDVYRSERAAPPDWVMIGNHDTPSIWRLLDDWERTGTLAERARYLAWRLAPDERRQEAFAQSLLVSPGQLAQAQLADLLACPARNVQVFFTDAFGLRERYNQGGVLAPDNWTLRLPTDYERRYRERLASDAALNLPLALAMALRAPRDGRMRAPQGLIERLDALATANRHGANSLP